MFYRLAKKVFHFSIAKLATRIQFSRYEQLVTFRPPYCEASSSQSLGLSEAYFGSYNWFFPD